MHISKLFDLSGKVALVTGGGRGLGAQAAIALAEAGADVAICGLHTDGTPVAEEIQRMGRRSFFAKADVTKSAEIDAFVADVVGRLGKIDILVNNAGIGTRGQSLETVRDEDWHEFMEGILSSQFYTARPVAKHMIARGEGGTIVNMSSINAYIISNIAPRYNVPYCVAKAGVAHLTHGMATNWAKYNIRVNAIAPGFIVTDMGSTLMSFPEIKARMEAGQPMGRFGKPEEIKGAVVFLASEASSYMTGGVVVMDGGATLW